MRKTCHKESCWLRHQCIKNDLPANFYLQNFSPKQPKEWKKKPNTMVNLYRNREAYETIRKKI